MSTLAALIPVLSWMTLNVAADVLLTIPVRYRVYVLPAILMPATVSFKTIQHLSFLPGLSELWGSITLISLVHVSSLLYIKKWTLRTRKRSKVTDTWLNRTMWTHMYRVALNPRFIRVPYKHVILSDQYTGSQVKSTAIHGKFSSTRILWLFVKTGMLFLLNRLAIVRLLGPITINDFTPAKAILLRRLLRSSIYHSTYSISMREIVMRLWVTMNTIWIPILLLDSIHTALAILFIHVLRIDIPDDWSDLFGSPLEAVTLGRFGTTFWHRLHLSGYSDYARLMLLRCTLRNAVTKRVLMTSSLFLISGTVHQLTSWQLNPGCSDYADLQFFCMNAAAVSLESALLQVISTSQTSEVDRRPQRRLRAALAHLVGYTWVTSFFVWAIPRFYYPRIYCTLSTLASV